MPPPTVQPLRVSDCWIPVLIGAPMTQRDLSIFAQAPPPVTYKSVLGPNHQKLVKPSRPRAVTNQRSCSSLTPAGLTGTGPAELPMVVMAANAWPDLLVAEPSPSMPKTQTPACQLQPPWKPPMKPLRLKEPVIGTPPASRGFVPAGPTPRAVLAPVVEKPSLCPELVPADAPT